MTASDDMTQRLESAMQQLLALKLSPGEWQRIFGKAMTVAAALGLAAAVAEVEAQVEHRRASSS